MGGPVQARWEEIGSARGPLRRDGSGRSDLRMDGFPDGHPRRRWTVARSRGREREAEAELTRRSWSRRWGPRAEAVLGEELGELLGGGGRLEPAGGAAAARARRDVDLEDVAEQPGPRLLPRLRSQNGPVVLEERELLRFADLEFGHDLGSELGVRAEHGLEAFSSRNTYWSVGVQRSLLRG